LQWGKAVFPKGTRAQNVRLERATVAGRNLRHKQGRGETGNDDPVPSHRTSTASKSASWLKHRGREMVQKDGRGKGLTQNRLASASAFTAGGACHILN
jgi:hypothetical protein